MKHVRNNPPEGGPVRSPEVEYASTRNPALKRVVLEIYRSRLHAEVRRMLPARFAGREADGQQAAAVGLLEALESYNPASPGRSTIAPFWPHARLYVRDRIRSWMGEDIYWRKAQPRNKTPERIANAERAKQDMSRASLDAVLPGKRTDQAPVCLHDLLPDDEGNVEDIVSEKELLDIMSAFVETLTPKEKASVTSGRYHLDIVERATAFLRGSDDDPRSSGTVHTAPVRHSSGVQRKVAG